MDNQFNLQINPSFPPSAPKRRGGIGPIVGIIVIVVLLVVGALYFWGAQLSKQQATTPEPTSGETANTGTETSGDSSTDALLTADSSDELSAIEADLNSTNTANLDADASEMDADIGSL